MVCSDCRYYNPTGDKQGKCERMSDEDFDMLVYADDDSLCPKFEVSNAYLKAYGLGSLDAWERFGKSQVDESWESVSK